MAWSHVDRRLTTLSILLLLLCHSLQIASAPTSTNQTAATVNPSLSSSFLHEDVIKWRITNTNLVLEIIHVSGSLPPEKTFRFLSDAQAFASVQPRGHLIGALGWDFGPRDGLLFTLEEHGSPMSWLVATNVVRGVLQYVFSEPNLRPLTFSLLLRGSDQVLGEGAFVQISDRQMSALGLLDRNSSDIVTRPDTS